MNAQTPSTAVANVEPAHQRVAGLGAGAVTAIVPQTFDDVYRFAQVLSRSGLVPYGMDTPEKVSVAILTGLEIGVKPMQAVQGIAVINGAPRVWGDLALAVVRGSGQLEKFKETFVGAPPKDWPKPTSDELGFKAVCLVKRKGEDEIEMEYSIEDAVVAKLWNKTGPKGPTPWVTNPKRMLKMRARAFALRDAFTDILKGMPIAEEMIGDDVEDADYQPVNRGRGSAPLPPPPPTDEALGFQPGAPEEVVDAAFSKTQIAAPEASSPSEATKDTGAALSPQPAAPVSEPSQPAEDAVRPEDEIARLDETLAACTDESCIAEGYDFLDIEATLSRFDGMVEKARAIRDAHLARVTKLAAAAAADETPAPPPPPALDEEPAAGPAEPKTVAEYDAVFTAHLAACKDQDDILAFRKWWGSTRKVRDTLDLTMDQRRNFEERYQKRAAEIGA